MNEAFITEIKFRLNESLPRIDKCLNLLTEKQVWHKPNEQTNSIGNLILHVAGNIRQYSIDGFSNTADNRQRSLEFSAKSTLNKKELFRLISETIAAACKRVEQLTAAELEASYSIQGFNLTGISVAVHVVEHLSYHTGQMAIITKMITNKDLGFYADMDLNITN